jgi:hypothetical protein
MAMPGVMMRRCMTCHLPHLLLAILQNVEPLPGVEQVEHFVAIDLKARHLCDVVMGQGCSSGAGNAHDLVMRKWLTTKPTHQQVCMLSCRYYLTATHQ